MSITTKKQRQQRRDEAFLLIANGVPLTDAAAGFGDEGWVRVSRIVIRSGKDFD